ncbi:MAG: isochorismatase family protein, partial [Oxalobacteraceae bacterium]
MEMQGLAMLTASDLRRLKLARRARGRNRRAAHAPWNLLLSLQLPLHIDGQGTHIPFLRVRMTNLHPHTTALVLIDLQHGNVARELAPYPPSQVLANSVRLADAFRAAGATIVYVRVSVGELATHQADRALPGLKVIPPNPSDIVPEAGMQEGDFLVTKRQWGAFHA